MSPLWTVTLLASAGVVGFLWILPPAEAADPFVGTGDGLRGYYFPRTDFTRLHTVRLDPLVSFSWGTGAPAPGMPTDGFSVRWTGEVQAQHTEAYTFSAVGDDWAQVYVDGVLATGPIAMTAGEKKPIRVEMAEGCCSASVSLRWQSPSTPLEVIPTSQLYATPIAAPVVGNGTGLLGYYYQWGDFTRLAGTRVDPTLSIGWGAGSPFPGVGVDGFSARWLGQVQAQRSEAYYFWVSGDDWASLWVDGQRLAANVGGEVRVGPVAMTAGETYDLKAEMAEGCCSSGITVRWESASTPYSDIPTSQLYPAPVPSKLVGSGDGLRGYYYAASDFTRFTTTRVDASPNFQWGASSPAPGLPVDGFAVRWLGTFEPQLTESYRFYGTGDDTMSLWVDGQRVLHAVAGETRTSPIPLVAGQRYDIKVELVEGCCSSSVSVLWESSNTTLQPLPTTQLYSAALPAPVVGDGTGLRGLYFASNDFSRLFASRIDPTVSFDWGASSPIPGMPSDGFAVRWHGFLEPTRNESYRFYASGDDWASVWLDGVKILHQVGGQTRTAPIPLAVGTRYSIMVELMEGCCSSSVSLLWEGANETLKVVPQAQLYPLPAPVPANGDGDGLLGKYYTTTSFTGLHTTRVDPGVSFQWGAGAPAPGMPGDGFSVRWTGQLLAPYGESYRFSLSGDDWASLWVDGALLLDRVGGEARSAPVALAAGTWHDVRVDMVEGCCSASVSLKWESGNQTFGVVPQAYLSSGGFSFERSETAVRERAGNLVADVVLGPAQPVAVTVDYATSALTASPGSDYVHTSGTLTFSPGETRKTILVPVLDDGVDEANETFRLALSGPVGLHLGRRPMLDVTLLDETPPVTTGALQGLLGDNDWFVSPVDVTLTTSSSSAATIFWRIDPGLPFETYAGPVTVATEGHLRLDYYAVDELGVEEIAKNLTFGIDRSAPITTVAFSGTQGGGGWWRSDVTATVSATDAHAGVATTLARLDDAPLAPYVAPFLASGSGVHSILMQSSDLAGLVETPVEVELRIDVTPPISSASVTGVGANGWFRGPATVALSASDAHSGSPTLAAVVGPGPLAPYAEPLVLADEGDFTVRFAATDLAGVVEATRSQLVRLDLSAPLVGATVESQVHGGWHTPLAGRSFVRIALSGSDARSGLGTFQWASPTLTGNATLTLSGAAIDVSQGGEHVLYVRALDLAGNAAAWLQIGPLRIDATPPVITHTIAATPGSNGWFRDVEATVTLTATDGAAGSGVALLEVSAEGGAFTPNDGPFVVSGEGVHALTARATDFAGLVRTLPIVVRLDATAPAFGIALDGYAREDGSFATAVTVTLTASDAVSLVPSNGVTHNAPGVPATQRTFTLTSDGAYDLLATAVDTAGNAVSLAESFEILRDVTQPLTTSNAPSGWQRGTVTVRFTAVDSESAILATYVEIDGVPATIPGNGARTRVFELPVAGAGAHTLVFASEDVAGNREADRTASFLIDPLAPATAISVESAPFGSVGASLAYADEVALSFSATDAGGSGLLRTEYRVDAGAWQVYAGGTIRVTGHGLHTVRARSIDVAGNVEGERTVTFGIDAAAPVVAPPSPLEPPFDVRPDGLPVFGAAVNLTLSASDLPIVGGGSSPVTIEWRLCSPCAEQPWVLYGGPISVATEGRFTLRGRVTDAAGHLSLVSYSFLVDLTTPVFDLTLVNEVDLLDVDGVAYLDAEICLRIPALDLPLVPDPDAEPLVSALRNVSWIILNATDDVVDQRNVLLDPWEHYNVTVDVGCFELPHGSYKMRWGGCDGAGHCRLWGGPLGSPYCECGWFHFAWDHLGPDVSIVWPPPNSVSLDAYTLPILPSAEECAEAYRLARNEALAVVCSVFVGADGALAALTPAERDAIRATTLVAGQVPVLVRAYDAGVGTAYVELYVDGVPLGRANATDHRGYYAFLVDSTTLVPDGEILVALPVLAVGIDRHDNGGLDARAMTFVDADPPTEALPRLDLGLEPETRAIAGAMPVAPIAVPVRVE